MVFSPQTKGTFPSVREVIASLFFLLSHEDAGHTTTSFPYMCLKRPVVDRVGLCCRSWNMRCAPPLPRWSFSHHHRLRTWRLDLATFACIIVFIRELRVTFGQERKLSHLVKTLIQDSTVYFFIMLTFNVAMLTYAVMARASLKNFPLV